MACLRLAPVIACSPSISRKQIYYDEAGDQIGPTTVSDGIVTLIDPTKLLSDTAVFTQQDVGSFLISDVILPGTTIDSVESGTQATITAQPGGAANVTFTIASRTNPVTFDGDIGVVASGYYVHSIEANFTARDVGRTIVSDDLPAGTFITRIAGETFTRQYTKAFVNVTGLFVVSSTFTIPGRTPNLGSTDAFHDEPFQCALYYAPSNDERMYHGDPGRALVPDHAGKWERQGARDSTQPVQS